jgi:hypothetical protein
MLRVVPPRAPEQIGFAAIRELLLYLFTELHFRPGAISYDGFESTESMQIIQDNLKANPILWAATKARKKLPRYPVVGHLSVDKHSAPYESLRSAVMEARMISYEYAPYLQEIVLLQRDPESGKVDHLPSMSKDVSDAVAGVCFHCSEQIKSSDVEVAEAQKHGSLSPPLKGGGPALPWSVADYKVYDNDD